MKKLYTSPELTAENLNELDVITASGEGGEGGVTPQSEVDNAYFSIMNLFDGGLL